MGCGISTLDAEDASLSRRSIRHRQRAIVPPPVTENNNFYNLANKDFENGNEGVTVNALGNDKEMKPTLGDEEAKRKEVGPNNNNNNNEEKLLREKSVDKIKVEETVFESRGKEEHENKHVTNMKNVNVGEEHEENKGGDDSIIAPGSPSFRDYCVDSDSGDRSSVWDSNDCDSGDSTKNGSDDGSTNMKNKPKKEDHVYCNTEPEKKERSGRGFRNVINKGKARGKRNLLNFGCYNASSESYPESSFAKTAGKTA